VNWSEYVSVPSGLKRDHASIRRRGVPEYIQKVTIRAAHRR
jgi:hypothetical protein